MCMYISISIVAVSLINESRICRGKSIQLRSNETNPRFRGPESYGIVWNSSERIIRARNSRFCLIISNKDDEEERKREKGKKEPRGARCKGKSATPRHLTLRSEFSMSSSIITVCTHTQYARTTDILITLSDRYDNREGGGKWKISRGQWD